MALSSISVLDKAPRLMPSKAPIETGSSVLPAEVTVD